MNIKDAKQARTLQLNKLEELRNKAYENSKIANEKVKIFYDKKIIKKEFHVGQQVLLYNSRLHLVLGKFRFKWSEPYEVHNVYPHEVIEIVNLKSKEVFKINGQ